MATNSTATGASRVVQESGEILMLVAGQDDDIAEPAHPREQPLARHLIAGPAVHVEDRRGLVGAGAAVERHHHDLLGEAIPARLPPAEIAGQPRLLLGAEDLGGLGADFGTGRLEAVLAGLVGAELAGVEEIQLGEIAVAGAAIEAEIARRGASVRGAPA